MTFFLQASLDKDSLDREDFAVHTVELEPEEIARRIIASVMPHEHSIEQRQKSTSMKLHIYRGSIYS